MAQPQEPNRSARLFRKYGVLLPLAPTALAALLLFLSVGDNKATAQVAPSPQQSSDGRFSLAPVEGGVLRLDRQTGEMTLCTTSGKKLTCDPIDAGKPAAAAPRGAALDNGALADLRRENDELRARIRSLEDMVEAAPGVDGGPPPPAPIDPSLQVPSEEDIDRALDTVERVFRKFRDRIRRFNEPLPETSPAPGGAPGGAPDGSPGKPL